MKTKARMGLVWLVEGGQRRLTKKVAAKHDKCLDIR